MRLLFSLAGSAVAFVFVLVQSRFVNAFVAPATTTTTTTRGETLLGGPSYNNQHLPILSRSTKSSSSFSTTALAFGIPSFLTPKNDDEENDNKQKKKVGPKGQPQQPKGVELEKKGVGMKGLIQLITAGAGAPFLGDFEGVDKETGNFMFSLEANNLVDKDGKSKQTQMPYFENGWVDPEDEKRAAQGFKLPWQK